MEQLSFWDVVNGVVLSDEQQNFIDVVKEGKNVLVDACIGSGKTTSIQYLCKELYNKKILYLTYNKLLKVEAKKKLKGYKNVFATNYHGYAYWALSRHRIKSSVENCIHDYIQNYYKGVLRVPYYDIIKKML